MGATIFLARIAVFAARKKPLAPLMSPKSSAAAVSHAHSPLTHVDTAATEALQKITTTTARRTCILTTA